MPRPAVRPADLTGKLKAELAEKHAEELKAREKEILLINQADAEEKEGVVDLTESAPEAAAPEFIEVELAERTKEFRVNTDLENVTIGRGTDYTFEVGRTYKAPQHVYDHLEEIGYIWH